MNAKNESTSEWIKKPTPYVGPWTISIINEGIVENDLSHEQAISIVTQHKRDKEIVCIDPMLCTISVLNKHLSILPAIKSDSSGPSFD